MTNVCFERDDFLLRNDMLLLNNGSFGACPTSVLESCRTWRGQTSRSIPPASWTDGPGFSRKREISSLSICIRVTAISHLYQMPQWA
jgi:hypothetical protein